MEGLEGWCDTQITLSRKTLVFSFPSTSEQKIKQGPNPRDDGDKRKGSERKWMHL